MCARMPDPIPRATATLSLIRPRRGARIGIVGEETRRVVLDAQHGLRIDRLAADQRILAAFELELQQIG